MRGVFGILLLGVAGAVPLETVHVRGPGDVDASEVAAAFRGALGERDDDALADAIAEAENIKGVGGIDLAFDGARLIVTYDGVVRRVHDVNFAFDDEAPLPPAQTWQLRQQIRARSRLYLPAGAVFHPFLANLERRSVRDDFRNRGFRNARVVLERKAQNGLMFLTYRVRTGPRFTVKQVLVEGEGLDGELTTELRRGMNTGSGSVAAPAEFARDGRHIRRQACRLGYPRAAVSMVERALPKGEVEGEDRQVEVRYTVRLGPESEVGEVQVIGYPVPWVFMRTLPLKAGEPYCDEQVDQTVDLLRGFLQERGFYDPRIVPHRRARVVDEDERVVSITFEVASRGDAKIARIWFTGNKVTREDIIRQRLAIKEGDTYRQSAVDASVQALRRTGLFRKVRLRVVDAVEPGQVYLYFDLDEQTPIRIDVVQRRVRLRNMDLANWPSDQKHLERGGFRGGGQEVALTGAPDAQGFAWRNPFLSRNWLTQASIFRRTASDTGFEASWYTLRGGVGLQGVEGRLSVLPYAELEWTNNKQDADADLPLLDGDALTLAGGLELSADLNRLDDERIPYIGLDIEYIPRAGRSVAGEDFGWFDHDGTLRIHLPLYTNKREQHVVLRLRNRFRQVVATRSGKLQPHRRAIPKLRGHTGSTVTLDFPVGDEVVSLGGLVSLESGVEIRIPLPLRRNAIIPFVEAASTGDRLSDLLEDRFIAPGLALGFSFFNEKLEGVLWAAYGLTDEGREYVGGSFGGAF